jgi:hypothetical protein
VPEELSTYSMSKPAIGMCKDLCAQQMVGIASQFGLRHFVHASHAHTQGDVKTAEIMLTRLDSFLNFPVTSILSPYAAAPNIDEDKLICFTRTFSCANEKAAVLDGVRGQLKAWKKSSTFIAELLLAADELFTNAIYNAPYVTFSENQKGVPRTAEYGNSPEIKTARMFLATDGGRIVLGCEDSYGTLNPDHLIARLKNCLENGAAAALNWAGGGAGLGTYLILRSALAFYVGVSEGKKTVVCCTYAHGPGRMQSARNIHFACVNSMKHIA